MGLRRIKKGLQLPITGEPEQVIYDGQPVTKVALLGDDYVGMKPTMVVKVGDQVKLGQVLFTDKKTPGVKYTSPGSGKVVEINRGAKRHFESVVIKLEGEDEVSFESYPEDKLDSLEKDIIQQQLIDSGLWTSFRTRPFSKVPVPGSEPNSIFITAMDTNPLAPDMDKILLGQGEDFRNGIKVISGLTKGKMYLCKEKGSNISGSGIGNIVEEEFTGPHPAGNAGTHIHFLDPVSEQKTVWYIGLQDVAAIGKLFTTGKLNIDRVLSLGGPSVKNPRLFKTRIGACLKELLVDELNDGEKRIISGSVLSGRMAHDTYGYLGKFHQQVSVLTEGRERKFLGWFSPGFNLHSVKNILISSLTPNKKFAFNTSQNGGERAIVPVGSYEKVMPLDILPTFLLRAIAANDIEEAEALGCLELDEEDLSLCSYVCPSKIDHGKNLREMLTLIEKEG